MHRFAFLLLAIAACDTTPPALSSQAPPSTGSDQALDLRGIGNAKIDAYVTEEGGVHARVLVDGAEVATSDLDCGGDCDLAIVWPTEQLAPGSHAVELDVTDDAGNAAAPQTWTASIDDVVAVTAFTTTDHLGPYVRLIDDASGTEIAETERTADGSVVLASVGGRPFGSAELAHFTGPVHFEVFDDEGVASESPSHTLVEWRARTAPIAFGAVTGMTLAFGRPFTGTESPLASIPTTSGGGGCSNDDLCAAAAGCNAGGRAGLATAVPLGFGIVLAARRRRRRAR